MGLIGCLETSVRNCHHSLRNNPEERSSHRDTLLTINGMEIFLSKYTGHGKAGQLQTRDGHSSKKELCTQRPTARVPNRYQS